MDGWCNGAAVLHAAPQSSLGEEDVRSVTRRKFGQTQDYFLAVVVADSFPRPKFCRHRHIIHVPGGGMTVEGGIDSLENRVH